MISGDMLSENPDVAISAFGPNRCVCVCSSSSSSSSSVFMIHCLRFDYTYMYVRTYITSS